MKLALSLNNDSGYIESHILILATITELTV